MFCLAPCVVVLPGNVRICYYHTDLPGLCVCCIWDSSSRQRNRRCRLRLEVAHVLPCQPWSACSCGATFFRNATMRAPLLCLFGYECMWHCGGRGSPCLALAGVARQRFTGSAAIPTAISLLYIRSDWMFLLASCNASHPARCHRLRRRPTTACMLNGSVMR